MGKFDFFVALKNYVQGKTNSRELLDLEDKIYKINDSADPNQSEILYDFGTDSDVLESVGLSDDDVFLYKNVYSHYGDEIYSYYQGMEDFENGYGAWDELSDENWDKLKYISQYLVREPFEIDTSFLEKFAKQLLQSFPKETNEFVDDYTRERNNQMTDKIKEHISNDIEELFSQSGLKLLGDGLVSVNVRKLFDAYVESGDLSASPKKIIKKIFENSNVSIGGWSNDMWEYQDSSGFDIEYFNREVERQLDSIIEKLEENPEESKKFISMYDQITKRFKIGVWYEIPKDKNLIFRITGFNRDEMKIEVDLKARKKDPSTIKKFKFSEDSFNKLLHQLELFKFGELHDF